jgi:pyridinium-3,5-bisthiocarboxylic acid mononucleotide nickel chelatase
MRIGYLDCFSGISGDMMLGALVDAGVSFELFKETTAALNIGAHLEMRKVLRGGIAGTKVDVISSESPEGPGTGLSDKHEPSHSHPHEHHHEHEHEHDHGHEHVREHHHAHPHPEHRSLSRILAVIRAAALPDAVKECASRAFQLLGEAEAAIHQIPVESVHFHEVGAVDTIVDLVCGAVGCSESTSGLLRLSTSAAALSNAHTEHFRCRRRQRWLFSARRPSMPPGFPWSG